MTRGRALPLLLLLGAGCGGLSLPRTKYMVVAASGMIVTNSPMLIDRRDPTFDESGLSVPYAIVAQNGGTVPVDLDLSQAIAHSGRHAGKVACRGAGQPVAAMRFAPGDRYRLDCAVSFADGRQWLAQEGDQDVILTIPLRWAEGESRYRIMYFLAAEDAR